MKRLIAALVLVAAVGITLALTAGGGRSTGDADRPGPAGPDLSVARLDRSGDFALSQLAAAKTPTLLWFWAPWCEVCNHRNLMTFEPSDQHAHPHQHAKAEPFMGDTGLEPGGRLAASRHVGL